MTEVASAESDLTFSVYPNGQLGDNAAMIQLVKAGVLDIAKVSASSMEQFNSAYAIFSMPYVFESTEQYFAVMNQSEAVQEIFKSTYDQGFFAIGWFDSGSRSIYTTKDGPCEGPADLKGLKIRTQDSPTSIAMIRAMGGSATPMSSGETYTGLQQGIIDGAENNETVLVQDGHGEVCKSYTYTQHQMVPDIVIISTETWESLDETEQSAIVNGMTQGNEAHEAVWQDLVQEKIDDLNAEIINTMTSIGMKEDEIAAKETELSDKQVQIDQTQEEYNIAKAQEEARELVARDQITQTAQAEAADIIAKAKEQGDSYIADAQNQASDILGNATNQANEMVTTAQNKSREMLTAVNNYADDTLLSIDDSLYKALADVRRIRKGIEDTQNKNK